MVGGRVGGRALGQAGEQREALAGIAVAHERRRLGRDAGVGMPRQLERDPGRRLAPAERADRGQVGGDLLAQDGVRPRHLDRGAVIAASALGLHPGGPQRVRHLGIVDALERRRERAARAGERDRPPRAARAPPQPDHQPGVQCTALGQLRGELKQAVALEQGHRVARCAQQVRVHERRAFDVAGLLELLGRLPVELAQDVGAGVPRRGSALADHRRRAQRPAPAPRQPQAQPAAAGSAEDDRVAQRGVVVLGLEGVDEPLEIARVAAAEHVRRGRAQDEPRDQPTPLPRTRGREQPLDLGRRAVDPRQLADVDLLGRRRGRDGRRRRGNVERLERDDGLLDAQPRRRVDRLERGWVVMDPGAVAELLEVAGERHAGATLGAGRLRQSGEQPAPVGQRVEPRRGRPARQHPPARLLGPDRGDVEDERCRGDRPAQRRRRRARRRAVIAPAPARPGRTPPPYRSRARVIAPAPTRPCRCCRGRSRRRGPRRAGPPAGRAAAGARGRAPGRTRP